jgi:hypothetical protein
MPLILYSYKFLYCLNYIFVFPNIPFISVFFFVTFSALSLPVLSWYLTIFVAFSSDHLSPSSAPLVSSCRSPQMKMFSLLMFIPFSCYENAIFLDYFQALVNTHHWSNQVWFCIFILIQSMFMLPMLRLGLWMRRGCSSRRWSHWRALCLLGLSQDPNQFSSFLILCLRTSCLYICGVDRTNW